MSAALTCAPADRTIRSQGGERASSHVHAGGRLTLEQRLDSVWEGLRAGGAGSCPVCHGELASAAGAATARCGGCGSVLF